MEIYNPSAEALFGFSADDVLGQHVGRLLPETAVNELSTRLKTNQQKKTKGTRSSQQQKEVVLPLEDEEVMIKNKSNVFMIHFSYFPLDSDTIPTLMSVTEFSSGEGQFPYF